LTGLCLPALNGESAATNNICLNDPVPINPEKQPAGEGTGIARIEKNYITREQ
jgi:hypothetical protein